MPEIAKRLRSVSDEDGTAILDIENNCLVSLNVTGSFVWKRLMQGVSVQAIVQELSGATGVEPSIVNADIKIFMDHLIEHRMLSK